MDYTIEVWSMQAMHYPEGTVPATHFAECSCEKFSIDSESQSELEAAVRIHRKYHQERGDSTEIV